jgi:hypothetical protein
VISLGLKDHSQVRWRNSLCAAVFTVDFNFPNLWKWSSEILTFDA